MSRYAESYLFARGIYPLVPSIAPRVTGASIAPGLLAAIVVAAVVSGKPK